MLKVLPNWNRLFYLILILIFSAGSASFTLPVQAGVSQTYILEPDDPVAMIEASLSHDWVHGTNFTADADLSLDIYDSPGGTLLYETDAWTQNDVNNWWLDLGAFGVDLQPGYHIVVSDTVQTKDLTLDLLSLTDFDPSTDTVSGEATPGVNVEVSANGYQMTSTADGTTGAWTAVFGDDLLENMRITAWVNDADGDATVVESPWLHAIPMDEHVGARNFTPNSSVTLVVFDTDGVSPLIDPQTVSTEPNGHAEIPLWGLVDLDPGQFIEVSDDSTGYSKRMEVKYVTLDRVDTVADFAEGVAPADAAMILHLMDNGMNYGFDLTADGSGHWEFDFTQPGVALDLSESAWVDIWVVEPDGDATSDDLPVFQASVRDDWVEGHSFTPNAPVTVEIYASPGDLVPLAVAPVGSGTNGEFWLEGTAHGIDLQVGNYLVAIDDTSTFTKTLLLEDFSIDYVDYLNDKVNGTSPALRDLWVDVNDGQQGFHMEISSDEFGDWVADFGSEMGVDLLWDTEASAALLDADKDKTVLNAPYRPVITTEQSHNWVQLDNFAPSLPVDLEIFSSEGGLLVFTGTKVTDGNGWAWWNLGEHAISLQHGNYVRATDGYITKTLTVLEEYFDYWDLDTDTAYGTAQESIEVLANVYTREEGWGVFVTAGPAGSWSVDFTPHHGNIPEYVWANAQVTDEDGDAVIDHLQEFRASYVENFITGNSFRLNSELTIEIHENLASWGSSGTPLYTGQVTTNDHGDFFLGGEVHGVNLEQGMLIAAYHTDAAQAKLLEMQDVTVEYVDRLAGIVSGTAPVGAPISLQVDGPSGWQEWELVAEDGTWMFDTGGPIDPQAWHFAVQVRDEDWDSTLLPVPHFIYLPLVLQP